MSSGSSKRKDKDSKKPRDKDKSSSKSKKRSSAEANEVFVVEENGHLVITHGTLRGIVSYLASYHPELPRPALISFFIGYRQFETPMALFSLVKSFFAKPSLPDAPRPTIPTAKHNVPSSSSNVDASTASTSTSTAEISTETISSDQVKLDKQQLRIRTLSFIQLWLEASFSRDFFEENSELYESLLNFLNDNSSKHQADCNRLKLLILRLRKARREAVKLQRGAMDMKKLLPKKLNFLDLNVSEVAEQLTLIESEMFRRIQSHEFLKLSWRSKDRAVLAPGVVAMVERFNMVSFWVATEIVFQKEQKARTAILKKFINLAEKCLELNNFNTVMEILGGMNNVAVQRLKRTWAALSDRAKSTLDDLNDLMDTKQNYKNYRDALELCKVPVVPYLGITLRDLTFIEEGNDDLVDFKYVNHEKLALLGHVVMDVNALQEAGYKLKKSDLFDHFKKLIVFPDEVMYNHSLRAEPPRTADPVVS
mmetsp:Transcript_9301/g.23316  ORF Transcript_9301/g.23316 Transcript_9301/m.23316 type:complete len:480 (-) Transcript_9301:83-1522(-)|eukprot:CAMPEP_0177666074 /NCGR_PEP_ID=MMETSP0447-20121125/21391_1 /TAXON_ID=0 /ORGANISM="Stygamoeba regulata, Strain BSH-02190019" /LENGTH=479 /DNA_ID=CAMNT_0019172205 /DNA_START=240 /DNA_END=1679 /DNA_ORIENTATION=-